MSYIFLRITQCNAKPYPYDHLRRLDRQIFENDEVTTWASLSMGTSPTTESTTPLNPKLFAPMENRTQDLKRLIISLQSQKQHF